ncbi:MAG: alpha-N-acetylglucosaminidase [Ferruginibacter sp.]
MVRLNKYWALYFIFLGCCMGVSAQKIFFGPVKSIAERRVPWLSPMLRFDSITRQQGKDIFILQTVNNKVVIKASGVNAAAKGLGYYLKNYCHRSMSFMGDNLSLVMKAPVIDKPVKIVADATIRYALNYCTESYTMSFYKWNDWQHVLDYMALNGVNLMLAPIGTEAVWQNTLQKIGFSQEEILKFIPGPAYTAWWLMGNLEGWGGAVTQGMIDQQVVLQKNILLRMQQLGIQPVLHGFYGMVPNAIAEKRFSILPQGKWAGGFIRTAILNRGKDFKTISGIYYSELKKLYGDDIKYFAGDPFHEGGNSKGVDVKEYGEWIQQAMQKDFPASTWVLQGWQKNPSTELLSGLDKSKVLVQELFGENTRNWYDRNGYEGTPFIWCTVTNFGEKSGLYGKLQRFADEVYAADTSRYASLMKGVGIMPEGLHNNPVVYDFILDLGWHKEHVDAGKWLPTFVESRYGVDNIKIQNAWQIFLQTIYASFDRNQEGPGESVFCARPSMDIESASSWGTTARNYDTEKFKEAVKQFVSAAGEIKNTAPYEIDKTDLVRQVLSNKGETVYAKMITAFKDRNVDLFKELSSQFLSLIQLQDSLLQSNDHFQLYRWLKQADDFGNSLQVKLLALKNAKMQITYWGPENANTDLHDYANKEWGGLMRSFYLPRWQMFVKESLAELNGNVRVTPDYFSFERDWCNSNKLYPPIAVSSAQKQEIINKILSL